MVSTVIGRILATMGLVILLLLLGRVRGVAAIMAIVRIWVMSIMSGMLLAVRWLTVCTLWRLLRVVVTLLIRGRTGRVCRIVRGLTIRLLLLRRVIALLLWLPTILLLRIVAMVSVSRPSVIPLVGWAAVLVVVIRHS